MNAEYYLLQEVRNVLFARLVSPRLAAGSLPASLATLLVFRGGA